MGKYKHESLVDYYERRPEANTGGTPVGILGSMHLNVFYLDGHYSPGAYKRRNFYIVALILNKSSVQINDVWYNIKQPALLFSTPATSYEWRTHLNKRKAWICIFTEDMLYTHQYKESMIYTSLTQFNNNPVFPLNASQCREAIALFETMNAELKADYALKQELLRNYLSILFHFGNKLSSALVGKSTRTASSRLTDAFVDLLNRQFPIHVPMQTLSLKSAADFACQLSVHINHLNHAVMETKGKTTTELIAERLLFEAVYMLRHSQLTVSQIAYCLGFKEVAYFHRFFKKRQGISPGQARR
ncbi:helix-turn-helix transcriptional regulator [Mucilaginibacter rigui]|uniref:Helix-turn-helix transcriptional regulator n=1 Tax=Mucilaginibacter rigui TaxID=534635 RepID=A0ABR7X7Z2_9SPHI|nr:AraC family transcriptional regulator [Mucilaginibacter rigui]MBD1386708.1 helix-turn-helix transcriptional regulator [Mucilaginibacter rigui]